jgi:hypothetical protein
VPTSIREVLRAAGLDRSQWIVIIIIIVVVVDECIFLYSKTKRKNDPVDCERAILTCDTFFVNGRRRRRRDLRSGVVAATSSLRCQQASGEKEQLLLLSTCDELLPPLWTSKMTHRPGRTRGWNWPSR